MSPGSSPAGTPVRVATAKAFVPTLVNGVVPIPDADDLTAQIRSRDRLNGAASYSTASELNEDGFCPMLAEGRYVRGRVTVASGDVWTFASGIVPDAMRAGRL